MQRRPLGYVGVGHETIGSDIVAVLRAVHAPELTLGPELAERVRGLDPQRWYPIGLLLELLEKLEARLGDYGLRSMGWSIFQTSHAEAVRRGAHSARDIVFGIDGMYRQANRGQGIGGWRVLRFEPGLAELEKTTPHHCLVEEGILQEALRCVGVTAEIEQPACLRRGAETCRYRVRSRVADARWDPELALPLGRGRVVTSAG